MLDRGVGRLGIRLLPLAGFLIIWQLLCQGSPEREFLFSTPARVAERFWSELKAGQLPVHALVTGSEAVVGFLLATCIGTLLGLLFASVNRVSYVMAPYVQLLGTVPVYAVAPMTIVWFGIGFWQKAGIAFLSTVFLATSQAFRGAAHPPEEQLLVLRAFHATQWQILWRLRFPVALTWVVGGARLNVGFALLGAFLGEIIASNQGLGHYIMRASSLYDVPRVISGLMALVIVAAIVDTVIVRTFECVFPHERGQERRG